MTPHSQQQVATNDGLALVFSNNSSCIDHVHIDGQTLRGPPGQCQYGVRVFDHSSLPVVSSLLVNGDFADGEASVAANWTQFGTGYTRETGDDCLEQGRCIRVENHSPAGEAGAMQIWTHTSGQPYPSRLAISGWMRAPNMTGDADAFYSVYCDITYEDGDHYWAATAVGVPGNGLWRRALRVVSLPKPVHSISVYALLRAHVGVAWFASLGVDVLETAAIDLPAISTSPTWVALDGMALTPPLHITANFSALDQAINISMWVAGPGQPSNRGLTVELALPIPGSGWAAGQSLDDMAVLPVGYGAVAAGVVVDGLPGPLDNYPVFALQHESGVGLAVALPVLAQGWVRACRAVYLAAAEELVLSCDYSLTSDSVAFPAVVPYTALVFKLDWPDWGLRAALDKFYRLCAPAFDASAVRLQGNWLPFLSDISAIENVSDFGIRYQEGAGDPKSCQNLNQNDILIFPYIEPHLVHWPLPPDTPIDQAHVEASIADCVLHPDSYPTTQQVDCVAVSKYGARDALGHLRWIVERAPWNVGAMFSLDINAAFATDPASRCAGQLRGVQDELDNAVRGNYSLAGIYIDSTDGSQLMLNYNNVSLRMSRSPLLVDSYGQPVALLAEGTLSFLQYLRELLQRQDMLGDSAGLGGSGLHLMGNTLYVLPHLQLSALFAVAGIETNWHPDPGPAWLTPPPRTDMLFQRAMAGQRPYIFLQNTDFDSWTVAMTGQYFQVCVSLGLWPSFFSHNAADHQYFSNATLFNRDRPLFRIYVPILRALNAAGWQPITYARVREASSAAANAVFVERFGPLIGGSSIDRIDGHYAEPARHSSPIMFLTVRNEGRPDLQAGLTLDISAAACGLSDGSYTVQELVGGRTVAMAVLGGLGQLLVASNTTGAPTINTTLVLALQRVA